MDWPSLSVMILALIVFIIIVLLFAIAPRPKRSPLHDQMEKLPTLIEAQMNRRMAKIEARIDKLVGEFEATTKRAAETWRQPLIRPPKSGDKRERACRLLGIGNTEVDLGGPVTYVASNIRKAVNELDAEIREFAKTQLVAHARRGAIPAWIAAEFSSRRRRT